MRSPADNGGSDVPVVIGRRSARMSVIVPLTIRGVAANGKPFKENTWTIGINKQGAKLFAFHEPSVGEEITLENPVLGRTAKGKVVRVCEKRFPEDPYEIAVELTDAQNVWGVKFPPEDWQRDRRASSASQPPAKAGQSTAPVAEASAPAPASRSPEDAERSLSGSASPPKGANGQTEDFNQVKLAISGLSQFAGQAGEGKNAAGADEKPLGPKESQSPAYYQEALRLLEGRIRKVYSLERDLGGLAGRIEESRAELEGLLSKIREAEQSWQEGAERVRRDIQEASEQALQSSLEKAKLKIEEALTAVSSKLMEAAQKRFQEESSAGLEGLLKTAQTRLTGSLEEWQSTSLSDLQQRKDALLEKAQGEVSSVTETRTAKFREELRKLAEELSASLLNEVQKSIEAAARSATAQYAESFQGQAESARHEQEAALHKIVQEAQRNLNEQIAKEGENLNALAGRAVETTNAGLAQGSQKVLDALNATAAETLAQVGSARQKAEETWKEEANNFRRQLAEASTKSLEGSRNYMEAQFRGLKTEIEEAVRQTQQKSLQEAAERLRKMGEETRQSLSAQAQKAAEDELARIKAGLAAAGEEALGKLRERLAALGQSTRDSLVLDAKAVSEEYHAHLGKVSLEFQERSGGELAAHFRSILDRQREGVAEQLRKEAAEAGERASAEIRSYTERAVKEASDAMYKQVGVAAVTMKGWSDDARAQVESDFQKSLADFQQQLSELSAASLSTYHAELRILTENVRARLEKASQLFQSLQPAPTERPDQPTPSAQAPASRPRG